MGWQNGASDFRPFNPFVVGSIPAQPTNKKKGLRENVTLFFVQNFNTYLMCGFNSKGLGSKKSGIPIFLKLNVKTFYGYYLR